MSRNKEQGRYAGKHNGRHYRGVVCDELSRNVFHPFPSNLAAFSRKASWNHRSKLHVYSRKQRKANY